MPRNDETGTMSSPPSWEQYVFVSFGEDDKEKTFISDLFRRLHQVGIGHFGEENREGAGKKNEDKRLHAIHQPTLAFALLVFSGNYVGSSPCLKELVEILFHCEGKPELVVIPIFIMDKADVLNLVSNKKFKKILGSREIPDAQKKWSALANAGYELKAAKGERNLIDKIVGRLVNEIYSQQDKKFTFGPFGDEGQNGWESEEIDGEGRDEEKNDGKGIKVQERDEEKNDRKGKGINVEGRDEENNDRKGKGIKVEYEDFIKSVTFKVDKGTDTKPQSDGKSFKVELEDQEYITSFAGSQKISNGGCVLISSLTFRTNKRILGPIGRVKEAEEVEEEMEEAEKKKKREEREKKEEEEYFSVPLDAGKVTEFYWRKNEGNYFLASVGACVRLHHKSFNPFPSVGLFGRTCDREPMWVHEDVRKIHIHIGQKEERPDSSAAQKKKNERSAKNEELSGGPFIRLIKFTCGDQREWKHGSETGLDPNNFLTIELDDPEYLTSISGYYTDDKSRCYRDFGIISLTFRTNKRMAITIGEEKGIGKEKGIYFSSPAMAGKITGFYGYMDEHQNLCGIGACFERISDCAGRKFDGVRKLHLTNKQNFDSFKCVYDDGSVNGFEVTHPTGVSCKNEKEVYLDYPREYLTSISGYVGKNRNRCISSITFYSNKQRIISGIEENEKTSGIEEKEEYYFWYPSTRSRIIGFDVSQSFDHIEVQVEPIPHLYPFKTIGPPMKGSGGDPWDDGAHTDVRGFRVTFGKSIRGRFIKSITTWYDNNGSLVEGHQHGGQDASIENTVMIKLDFPKERLLRIKGCMRREEVDEGKFQTKVGEGKFRTIIHDLIIVSTRRSYGLFAPGKDEGKDETVPRREFIIPGQKENARIIGLFGMAGKTHLNSIGVRLEPY